MCVAMWNLTWRYWWQWTLNIQNINTVYDVHVQQRQYPALWNGLFFSVINAHFYYTAWFVLPPCWDKLVVTVDLEGVRWAVFFTPGRPEGRRIHSSWQHQLTHYTEGHCGGMLGLMEHNCPDAALTLLGFVLMLTLKLFGQRREWMQRSVRQ